MVLKNFGTPPDVIHVRRKHGCHALRLEAIPAAGRDSGGQHDETGVTIGCSGGPSAGFTTAESIRESLLSPLPDKLEVNAIEGQVGEECSWEEREYVSAPCLCRIIWVYLIYKISQWCWP